MSSLLAAASTGLFSFLLFLVGGGGAVAGIVALLKFRPDVTTASVVQAQGAVDAMAQANERLGNERNYWEARAKQCEEQLVTCRTRINELEDQIDRWSHLNSGDGD